MNSTTLVRPGAAAAAILPGLRRVFVPTRRRPHETWIDTPHARNPVRRDELDGDDRAHLASQMADIEVAAVQVTARLAVDATANTAA